MEHSQIPTLTDDELNNLIIKKEELQEQLKKLEMDVIPPTVAEFKELLPSLSQEKVIQLKQLLEPPPAQGNLLSSGGRRRKGKKSRKSRKGKKPRKGKKSRKNKRTKRR
jgi:hypothetical protein